MIPIQSLKEEIMHFIRNSDVISTTVRGVTTVTDEEFFADAGQTTYTPDNLQIKNVRELTVNGTNLQYLKDFTINWQTSVITFLTALTLNDDVLITYDYGTDKIFPDYPRTDLTLSSFPRIAVELTSGSTEPLGLGGINQITDLLITIFLWVPVNKDSTANSISGNSDLNNIMSNIRDSLRLNSKNFYSFQYIRPMSLGPIIKGTNDKILQISNDFQVKFLIE